MITFTLNGAEQSLDIDPNTPLLWAIRENLQLTGTKFGCGVAQCGACTVHLNGQAIRSCVTPLAAAQGSAVTTIEGLASAEGECTQFKRLGLLSKCHSVVTASLGKLCQRLPYSNKMPTPMTLQ